MLDSITIRGIGRVLRGEARALGAGSGGVRFWPVGPPLHSYHSSMERFQAWGGVAGWHKGRAAVLGGGGLPSSPACCMPSMVLITLRFRHFQPPPVCLLLSALPHSTAQIPGQSLRQWWWLASWMNQHWVGDVPLASYGYIGL